jgi:hypothetical protein
LALNLKSPTLSAALPATSAGLIHPAPFPAYLATRSTSFPNRPPAERLKTDLRAEQSGRHRSTTPHFQVATGSRPVRAASQRARPKGSRQAARSGLRAPAHPGRTRPPRETVRIDQLEAAITLQGVQLVHVAVDQYGLLVGCARSRFPAETRAWSTTSLEQGWSSSSHNLAAKSASHRPSQHRWAAHSPAPAARCAPRCRTESQGDARAAGQARTTAAPVAP